MTAALSGRVAKGYCDVDYVVECVAELADKALKEWRKRKGSDKSRPYQ